MAGRQAKTKGNIRVILDGPQGAGKSALADLILKAIADELGGTRRIRVYSTNTVLYGFPSDLVEHGLAEDLSPAPKAKPKSKKKGGRRG